MNIIKKIISAGMTIIAAGCIVTGSLSAGFMPDAPAAPITAEAATKLKDAVFPVNNGCKVAFVYGNSKEYGAPYREYFYVGGANSIRAFSVRSSSVVLGLCRRLTPPLSKWHFSRQFSTSSRSAL